MEEQRRAWEEPDYTAAMPRTHKAGVPADDIHLEEAAAMNQAELDTLMFSFGAKQGGGRSQVVEQVMRRTRKNSKARDSVSSFGPR